MFPPVMSKRDFVRRYAAGEFGNASPTWDDLGRFLKDGYVGPVHIRNRIAGGKTWYNVPSQYIAWSWEEALRSGLREKDLYISAMAPTECTTIQGEVMRTERGLYLYYTHEKKPMREALALSSQHVYGIMAVCLLKGYLCWNSYEWMMELLDRYRDHVVEFSTYSRQWGTIPHYNTVYWEVRKY